MGLKGYRLLVMGQLDSTRRAPPYASTAWRSALNSSSILMASEDIALPPLAAQCVAGV
jgi:hypothetical protein